MAAPSVNFSIVSNGLGNAPPSVSNIVAVLGTSSAGTAAVVKGPYTQGSALIADVGYGNAPELGVQLAQSGIPTLFVKVNTTTAGAASAVTHAGTGTSVMTVTGNPFDTNNVIVQVVRPGTAGSSPAPGIKISFDGGQNFTDEYRIPTNHIFAAFAATTGITLNFTAASMVAGDTYDFTTTEPTWAAADVEAAIDALKVAGEEFGLGYIAGVAAEADVNAIAPHINAFEDVDLFDRFIFEARDIDVAEAESEATWMAAIEADFVNFQNENILVAAGACDIASAIDGTIRRRNGGQLAVVRAGLVRVGRDIGAVADGPLLPSKSGQPVTVAYHDERLVPGLDAARFLTLTSYQNKVGFYVTNPNIMCPPGSDFKLLQYGRVADEACRIANDYFTDLLSDDVRLDPRTGFILEKDALAFESASDALLNDGLVATNNASSVKTTLSRTDKITQTETLTVDIAVQPKGYFKTINITLRFDATGSAS